MNGVPRAEPIPTTRALGRRPRLRKLAVVLWAGFLGAAVTLVAALLAPEDLLLSPLTLDRLATLFLLAWMLALVPAACAMLLVEPNPRSEEPRDAT